MKVSLSWLKEFVDFKYSPRELADRLMMSGIDIKNIKEPKKMNGIVVGEVLEVRKHPNADSLNLAVVDVGKNKLEIVCGAPNITVGQKVPVALVGATLPDGLVIEKRKIRGEESNGMICSEAELGLAEESSGIMVLPDSVKVGARFDELLGSDAILEADITPNRGDQLSVVGIEREVRALSYKKHINPKRIDTEYKATVFKNADQISVEVKNSALCPQYSALVLKIDKIDESPKWMQERLISSGVRPINSVVDVTNYVMLELGQPMHAFDFDKISGKKIIVRVAKSGEKLKTLDGEIRELSTDMLVIADAEKPIAIAGVIGGANSEITISTKTIVLESAEFDPLSIRKTAKKIGVRTEAVNRFEKKIDYDLPTNAINRAAHLLQKITGAEVSKSHVFVGKKGRKPESVSVEIDYINNLLGTDIKIGEAVQILEALGFRSNAAKSGLITCEVPSWRRDVSISEDLIEEVARIYGYQNIPTRLLNGVQKEPEANSRYSFDNELKIKCSGLGLRETVSYSFISQKLLEKVGLNFKEAIEVTNPISVEFTHMRPSLLPSLLATVGSNLRFKDDVRIFELASVYGKLNDKQDSLRSELGLCITGENSFKKVKGCVESILATLGIEAEFSVTAGIPFEAQSSAMIVAGGKTLGVIGLIASNSASAFDIDSQVSAAILDVKSLFELSIKVKKTYREISRVPKAFRDISFIVDEMTPYQKIAKSISAASEIVDIQLIDIYRGEQIPSGKKSFAFNLAFQANHTLNDDEVNDEFQKISNVITQLGGQIRKA